MINWYMVIGVFLFITIVAIIARLCSVLIELKNENLKIMKVLNVQDESIRFLAEIVEIMK